MEHEPRDKRARLPAISFFIFEQSGVVIYHCPDHCEQEQGQAFGFLQQRQRAGGVPVVRQNAVDLVLQKLSAAGAAGDGRARGLRAKLKKKIRHWLGLLLGELGSNQRVLTHLDHRTGHGAVA